LRHSVYTHQLVLSIVKPGRRIREFAIFIDTLLTCAEMQLLSVNAKYRAVIELFCDLQYKRFVNLRDRKDRSTAGRT